MRNLSGKCQDLYPFISLLGHFAEYYNMAHSSSVNGMETSRSPLGSQINLIYCIQAVNKVHNRLGSV